MVTKSAVSERGRYEATIMRLLRNTGPRSRTTLSVEMDLSPTTISKAVAPLIERGYIEERGSDGEMKIGRPAITLAPVPDAISVCGLQLGVGVAHLGLTNGLARVRTTTSVEFDPKDAPQSVLERVAEAIGSLLAADQGAPCIAIGVGAPGPVDAERRTNLMSINLGWRDVPIADLLERSVELPVVVDHNVRTMALAETLYGGHAVRDLAFIYVKTGVGLGLVLNGEPFYGGLHGLSELGHVRAVEDGRICACGARGCLETVVSEPVLVDQVAAAGLVSRRAARRQSPLAVLEKASAAGSRPAQQIRGELVEHLSAAMAIVVNLFNPELILLGGIFDSAPASLVDDLRAATRDAVYPILRTEFRIEQSTLDNPGVMGGAALALEKVLYDG